MTSFEDWSAALDAREAIVALIKQTVIDMSPPYRYGQVTDIFRFDRYCMVQFPEGGDPMPVQMGSLQPADIGQIVRVNGDLGDRFVEDVIGRVIIAPGQVTKGGHGTVYANNQQLSINAWNDITFDADMSPDPNLYDKTTKIYTCPLDAVYTCSGVIRLLNNGLPDNTLVDWATGLWVNGQAHTRLDEYYGRFVAGGRVELRLDFQQSFFAGTDLKFRCYSGVQIGIVERSADTTNENFSYFTILPMMMIE